MFKLIMIVCYEGFELVFLGVRLKNRISVENYFTQQISLNTPQFGYLIFFFRLDALHVIYSDGQKKVYTRNTIIFFLIL